MHLLRFVPAGGTTASCASRDVWPNGKPEII